MKIIKLIITTLFITTLLGCASKFQAPKNVTTPVQGVTKEQVKQAILNTSTNGRSAFGTWKFQSVDNNNIRGSLFNRKFEVVVNIPYSANGYSIEYVSASDNLKDKRGNVHRNYNRWINNLDARIRENIFKTK
ncbi:MULTISPECIES: hypothetical protein [unclassified Gilliamella]|uniref:hypothetical protein n=1 Tax=unclassified Gilliamella TaxID=2685620 RepID=UPI001C69770A|nr:MULTISPECIES: hypothetical protein [unclassified Gilliamella]MCX8601101.1 hypothetical protein [Gilliamella sp. B3722]MCX8607255.1 hypothetical protein [Gilliamella sp. B3771]MCX8610556.1 hypothetical protein [Gilliamella sp. B3891]MCX8612775.1 hypothetical protein [Gilliamella sp. B3773]MCX8614684.1 hypothetical protein [Gilliamella sp. B3770]